MTRFAIAALPMALALATPALAQSDANALISALQLTDARVNEQAFGDTEVIGDLPGGTRITLELRDDGTLEEVEGRRDALFPADEVSVLLPEAVLNHGEYPGDARLEKIEFDRDGALEIEGRDIDGFEFEMEFSAEGRLMSLERAPAGE